RPGRPNPTWRPSRGRHRLRHSRGAPRRSACRYARSPRPHDGRATTASLPAALRGPVAVLSLSVTGRGSDRETSRSPTPGRVAPRAGSAGGSMGVSRRSFNQLTPFQSRHHLVNGRWRDAKVLLHFGLGRRTSVNLAVVVSERQVSTLLRGGGCLHRLRKRLCPGRARRASGRCIVNWRGSRQAVAYGL